jgi:hypothetical protein
VPQTDWHAGDSSPVWKSASNNYSALIPDVMKSGGAHYTTVWFLHFGLPDKHVAVIVSRVKLAICPSCQRGDRVCKYLVFNEKKCVHL